MIIYVVVLNTLLISFAESSEGLKLMATSSKVAVFACADYITNILTSPADINAVRTALYVYQSAECAGLNLANYKTLPLNRWNMRLIL